MSFNLQEPTTFINIKLTDQGRRMLSLGALSFSKAVLSDREVDYSIDRTGDYIISNNRVLAPAEFYPEIENWIVHLTSFDVSEYFRDSISGRGSVVDLLSTIHDKNWELNTFDLDDIYPDFNTQEKMDAIREEIIQNRYTKFAYDW